MKKILRSALVGTAVGAIGLAACDAVPPPNAAVSRPVEPEAIPAGETLADVVGNALAGIVRDKDGYSRARRLGALLPTLGPEAVPAVEQMLGDPLLSLDLGATEIELLVRYWATQQPEAASRWAVNRAPMAYRLAAIFTSVAVWAEADPQAAVTAALPWLQRADVKDAVLIALVLGWFERNDPPELLQYIHALGTGVPQQRALSTYARARIRKQGTEAVMRWAESVPEHDAAYKTAVYRQVANAVAMADVEAGRRWCEAHCDGPYGKDLRGFVASNWALRDAAAALAWLAEGPEGLEKNLALRVVFAQWLQSDREAAMAWMAAQTTGEPAAWLQPIYPVYALALAHNSPAEAIVWAERTEEANREFTLIQIARAWRQRDEAAAEAWLLQSSLSEEAREKVRVPRPGR